jgi:hypothetical protein
MNPSTETPNPSTSRPLGQILKGRYAAPYRSRKGKLKGLQLQIGENTYSVKLPKYLRPMLVRELRPDTFVMVWAYREGDVWQGVNILPLSTEEAEDLQRQWQQNLPQSLTVSPGAIVDSAPVAQAKSSGPQKQCIQVCRKGKCFKQGGKHIWSILQSEVETNPELQHISIEATGCMKACKRGPNLKVLPKGKLLTGMTPEQALDVLANCQ